jgi:hypothetical protein
MWGLHLRIVTVGGRLCSTKMVEWPLVLGEDVIYLFKVINSLFNVIYLFNNYINKS